MEQPAQAVDSAGQHSGADLSGRLADIFGGDPAAYTSQIRLAPEQQLFAQGDPGDSLYVLLSGRLGVRVYQANDLVVEIDILQPGATVGEMALLSGQNRTATVYALSEATLLRLGKADFARLDPAARAALVSLNRPLVARWQRLELVNVLCRLFGVLDTAALHRLQAQLEWRHLVNGDVLFEQGQAADGVYIVVNGRLRTLLTHADGRVEAVGEVPAGELVGEYALLTDEPRSATVIAVRETNVVRMTRAVFEQLTRERPEWMAGLATLIARRQQRSLKDLKTLEGTGRTIAVLPAGRGVDVWAFAQELNAAMAQYGTTVALNSARFDEFYGHPGAAQTPADDPMNPALVSWMGDFECRQDYLLYVADGDDSIWTRRCLSQADRVLVVARPDGDPAPGPVEVRLAQMAVPLRTELVLWHPAAAAQPLGTAAWLDRRRLYGHHHLRQGDAGHMARLARRLTCQGIGLVLSGGAARGFAHLGVLRALEELAIPVDYVGGTSMGAVIGAGALVTGSSAQIAKVADTMASANNLLDHTLPFVSIMASRKVTAFAQKAYGDVQIEDLWVPFFCIASNLTTAEPVIYRRGPLWRAVRASLSIPGVFAPVIEDGEIIVDGGVMDNFPAQIMTELFESRHLIGVNVNPFRENKQAYDYDTHISGWRILLNRLNPFTRRLRVPSLAAILMRTLEINNVRRVRDAEELIDVMIHPDVRGVGMNDYDKFAATAQIGYEAALAPLRTWWAGMR